MSYQTKCPACDVDGGLYVIGGVFNAIGMNLCADGFSFIDAQQVSTEDENVVCYNCKRQFNLGDLFLDENRPVKPKRLKLRKRKGE